VLTIRAARSPGYYEQREFAREAYYLEAGRAEGRWLGRGAEELGLVGGPGGGDLEALLERRDPRTGEALSGARAQPLRNAGFDLTFTAPKSVSVLLAVGDVEVERAVLAAQEAGVRAALAYLEREACYVRRGHAGAEVHPARGFLGARYVHEMARSGDPHLHTHLVIANAAEGPDGRYTALDARAIFGAAKAAGALQEAVLRHELTQSLGVRWEASGRWGYEVAGVPPEVREHFSRRHREIEELAALRGWHSSAAREALQRETRDRKPQLEREEARADWRARAEEHGLGPRELGALVGRPEPPVGEMVRETQERALARALAGPEGLTRAASTFTEREVIVALAQAHPAGLLAEELERRARAFVAAWAIPVRDAEGPRPARYTTADMLRAEVRLLDAAAAPAPNGGPRASESALAEVLAGRESMGADQRAALVTLAGGAGAVRLLEAPAGSGKTYLLGALREAYERSGARVIGTAWQGQAARTLAEEAGIPAETAARLLGRLERERLALPPGCVLVVDEAGMMPTRPLERLLGHAAGAEALVILVGDRRQLPALDAGGAFGALADRLGAAQLSENRRQQDALGREVAAHLRAGEAGQALALLEEHGRLETHADARDAREALVGDWARECLPHPERGLILSHDRADVRELNRLARERMAEAGLLGAVSIAAHGRTWAAGDRLVCRRNDYRPELDVRNGTRGTVLAVDPWERSLLLGTDEGRAVRLPADYLQHVRHGYAVTAHTSQGATVERTYLLASPARGGREWSYVAGSRHREDFRVYLADHDPETAREALAAAWERAQGKRLVLDHVPADAISRLASRERTEQIATQVHTDWRLERGIEPHRSPGPRSGLGL
jgi:conjugative relaxase-like TrwC/TraI family protein